jgi:hypothetical protein
MLYVWILNDEDVVLYKEEESLHSGRNIYVP